MFWGLTPAVDLTAMLQTCSQSPQLPPELNILIVGATDCRHVLQTIAKRYRHRPVKLNFHLVETRMEAVARQLLLLITALQPMGLEQKTKVLMELHGNALVRPFTSNYLANVAQDLQEMVADYDYLRRKLTCIRLQLKYRERDYLESLLKFWSSRQGFDIVEIWDRRLRSALGARYDSKVGAFDWDLHMRLHLVGGRQVCDQEYRSFRLHGVAYSWLESEVSRPNRSLVVGVLPNGDQHAHCGYLGDMETGPFVAFGLDCEDAAFLKSTNGQNAFRATDVTERNVKQMLFEIEHQQPYQHVSKHEIQMGCALLRQEKLIVDVRAPQVTPKEIQPCLELPDISISFFSTSILNQMSSKAQYKGFFDIVYFAQSHLKHMEPDLVRGVTKELLVVEHELFVVRHRKKDLEEFARGVREKVAGLDLEELDFDLEKDSYFRFVVRKCV